MSQQFLKEGDAVVICGRHSDSLQAAVKALQPGAPQSQVHCSTLVWVSAFEKT